MNSTRRIDNCTDIQLSCRLTPPVQLTRSVPACVGTTAAQNSGSQVPGFLHRSTEHLPMRPTAGSVPNSPLFPEWRRPASQADSIRRSPAAQEAERGPRQLRRPVAAADREHTAELQSLMRISYAV